VMATSVYSLGVSASIGALFKSIQRGELPEVTQLIYQARENALELIRKEAQALGAERVIGNRLQIREIGSGLVEVVALGTAVRRGPEGMRPQTPQLIPQAVIVDKSSRKTDESVTGLGAPLGGPMARAQHAQNSAGARAVGLIVGLFTLLFTCCLSGLIPFLAQQ
ncbi:MAG: heavy metal-binding domain-containing protein, partial [Myxococcales bacterium]|nr:heavy metal-binding domain-containing protein [Myxococcales bacterium]